MNCFDKIWNSEQIINGRFEGVSEFCRIGILFLSCWGTKSQGEIGIVGFHFQKVGSGSLSSSSNAAID